MNSLNSVLSGLFSSLLLSLSFSRLAAKFDRLDRGANGTTSHEQNSAAIACVLPCRWQEIDQQRAAIACVLPCRWQEA